jgi:hypothetical protein
MKAALTCVALSLATFAHAQDLPDGTVDVYFEPQSVEGQLRSCSLVFTALVRDFTTQRGTQYIVNGSLAVRKMDEKDRFMLSGKLGTRPFMAQNAWEPPAYFFFATANRSTAGHAVIADSETRGYKLMIAPMNTEVIQFLKELGAAGSSSRGLTAREVPKTCGRRSRSMLRSSATPMGGASRSSMRRPAQTSSLASQSCSSRIQLCFLMAAWGGVTVRDLINSPRSKSMPHFLLVLAVVWGVLCLLALGKPSAPKNDNVFTRVVIFMAFAPAVTASGQQGGLPASVASRSTRKRCVWRRSSPSSPEQHEARVLRAFLRVGLACAGASVLGGRLGVA